MSEPKEIPAEILNDITFAINNFGGLSSNAADDLAVLVIEVARVPEMHERIAELEAKLREVVQSKDVVMPIELDEEITELLKRESAGGE